MVGALAHDQTHETNEINNLARSFPPPPQELAITLHWYWYNHSVYLGDVIPSSAPLCGTRSNTISVSSSVTTALSSTSHQMGKRTCPGVVLQMFLSHYLGWNLQNVVQTMLDISSWNRWSLRGVAKMMLIRLSCAGSYCNTWSSGIDNPTNYYESFYSLGFTMMT